MPGPLTDEEVRIGSAGMAVLFLGAPHVAVAWSLTHNFWAAAVLAMLTFFGSVHIWQKAWMTHETWSQLTDRRRPRWRQVGLIPQAARDIYRRPAHQATR